MADRTDLPRIKPTEEPSMVNHNAGKWGAIGFLAASIPAALVGWTGRTKTAAGIQTIGLVAGAIAGGLAEKSQTEREHQQGRIVREPGYWNKGILGGLAVAEAVQIPFRAAGKPVPWLFSAPLLIGSMIIGAAMRKNDLQKDFDRSVAARDAQQQALMAQLKAQQLIQGVTPEETALLAERMQRKASHGESVLQDRAMAATNENGR